MKVSFEVTPDEFSSYASKCIAIKNWAMVKCNLPNAELILKSLLKKSMDPQANQESIMDDIHTAMELYDSSSSNPTDIFFNAFVSVGISKTSNESDSFDSFKLLPKLKEPHKTRMKELMVPMVSRVFVSEESEKVKLFNAHMYALLVSYNYIPCNEALETVKKYLTSSHTLSGLFILGKLIEQSNSKLLEESPSVHEDLLAVVTEISDEKYAYCVSYICNALRVIKDTHAKPQTQGEKENKEKIPVARSSSSDTATPAAAPDPLPPPPPRVTPNTPAPTTTPPATTPPATTSPATTSLPPLHVRPKPSVPTLVSSPPTKPFSNTLSPSATTTLPSLKLPTTSSPSTTTTNTSAPVEKPTISHPTTPRASPTTSPSPSLVIPRTRSAPLSPSSEPPLSTIASSGFSSPPSPIVTPILATSPLSPNSPKSVTAPVPVPTLVITNKPASPVIPPILISSTPLVDKSSPKTMSNTSAASPVTPSAMPPSLTSPSSKFPTPPTTPLPNQSTSPLPSPLMGATKQLAQKGSVCWSYTYGEYPAGTVMSLVGDSRGYLISSGKDTSIVIRNSKGEEIQRGGVSVHYVHPMDVDATYEIPTNYLPCFIAYLHLDYAEEASLIYAVGLPKSTQSNPAIVRFVLEPNYTIRVDKAVSKNEVKRISCIRALYAGGTSNAMFATGETHKDSDVGFVRVYNGQMEPYITYQEHKGHISALVRYPQDAAYFYSSSQDATIRLWDIRQLKSAAIVGRHEGMVSCLSTNPLQPYTLASGGIDGVVSLWDVRAYGGSVSQYGIDMKATVLQVAVCPNSTKHVMAATKGKSQLGLRLCNFTDRTATAILRDDSNKSINSSEKEEYYLGLEFGAEGRVLYAVGTGENGKSIIDVYDCNV